MRNDAPLVVLTGPIASGKSTVGRLAVGDTSLAFYPEDVDSRAEDRAVLARYYDAVARYAEIRDPLAASNRTLVEAAREAVHATQVHFITRRASLLRGALVGGRGGVAERHPRDDIEIFSRRNLREGLLTEEQFASLETLLAHEMADVPEPVLHVFLHAETAALRQRIRRRGRAQEADLIRPENRYLEELNALYEDWFRRCEGEKILIRTDELPETEIAARVRAAIRACGID
ncbi:MAG: deoxynucleoside kinase [bacterium]